MSEEYKINSLFIFVLLKSNDLVTAFFTEGSDTICLQ